MIFRLDRSIKKILQMQNTTDRNFSELQMYLYQRMKNVLVLKKKLSTTTQIQTDEVDVELAESASRTQVRESKTEVEQSQVKERDDRVLEIVETWRVLLPQQPNNTDPNRRTGCRTSGVCLSVSDKNWRN